MSSANSNAAPSATSSPPLFPSLPVRFRRVLLLVCGALMLGLWAMQAHPYLSVANDAGRYMVLGESLARTGDLRLLNEWSRPRDILYPPGFPALIAFWLLATGRSPGGVTLLVKATQIALLIATLPLFLRLLERARMTAGYIVAALLTYACCPALIAYANEAMSEIPFLFLCLASVVLAERPDARRPNRAEPPVLTDPQFVERSGPDAEGETISRGAEPEAREPAPRLALALALLCAGLSFLVRSAGIALLIAQTVWFWRRYGWRWGVAAALVGLAVVGGWQGRSREVIRHAPPSARYATYLDQFSLRDPMRPGAGRIQLNPKGLLLRASEGVPIYVGMTPRSLLHTMAPPRSFWLIWFYVVAIPMTLLIAVGFQVGWQRGFYLSGGFWALFWLLAAMWPWVAPRFLLPLAPFTLLYLFLGVERVSERSQMRLGWVGLRSVQALAALLLLGYFVRVHRDVIRAERRPTAPGYALGRSREEGGFYAACRWLQTNAPANAVVMGRPAYLLHLYSGHPTTQIEPNTRARVQEIAYVTKRHVGYLVQDAWPWSHSNDYLLPYLREYGDKWALAWQDPQGSGVRVWRRL